MLPTLPELPLDDPFIQDYSAFIVWVLSSAVVILVLWVLCLQKDKTKAEQSNITLLMQSLSTTIADQQEAFAIQHTALADSLTKLDTTLSTLNNTVNTLSHDVDQRFHAIELQLELHKVRCQNNHADTNIGLNI